MCDLCHILSSQTKHQNKEQNVLHTRTISSLYKEYSVQIQLCDEHERLFFLKGERGFLRLFSPLKEAAQKGIFSKKAKLD